MGELVKAVECLNVLGDEMSDGIKQREGWHCAFHPPVSLAADMLLVCTLIRHRTCLNAQESLILLVLTIQYALFNHYLLHY